MRELKVTKTRHGWSIIDSMTGKAVMGVKESGGHPVSSYASVWPTKTQALEQLGKLAGLFLDRIEEVMSETVEEVVEEDDNVVYLDAYRNTGKKKRSK